MVTYSLTHLLTFMSLCWIQSLPDQTPNLANLMGVMRKHDLTNKMTTAKTTTKTNTKTMTMKVTNTFREHLQKAISETFDF